MPAQERTWLPTDVSLGKPQVSQPYSIVALACKVLVITVINIAEAARSTADNVLNIRR